jgi:hypothetical protein
MRGHAEETEPRATSVPISGREALLRWAVAIVLACVAPEARASALAVLNECLGAQAPVRIASVEAGSPEKRHVESERIARRNGPPAPAPLAAASPERRTEFAPARPRGPYRNRDPSPLQA